MNKAAHSGGTLLGHRRAARGHDGELTGLSGVELDGTEDPNTAYFIVEARVPVDAGQNPVGSGHGQDGIRVGFGGGVVAGETGRFTPDAQKNRVTRDQFADGGSPPCRRL